MGDGKTRTYELDRDATLTAHLSEDDKRLVLVEIQAPKEGLTKTGVNGLIDSLKKLREKMKR